MALGVGTGERKGPFLRRAEERSAFFILRRERPQPLQLELQRPGAKKRATLTIVEIRM